MPTLIAVYLSGKKRPRVCSTLCYNAKHPHCACVCGDRNHRKGIEQALKNRQEIARTLTSEGVVVEIPPVQLSLVKEKQLN